MVTLSIESNNKVSEILGVKIGEAVSHIIAAASIVEAIDGETEDVKETVRRYVDAWISEMVPIKYIPGTAELIGGKIKKRITEIFDEISEEELGETLDAVIVFKKSLESGEFVYNYDDIEVRIERILRALGIDMNVFSGVLDTNLNEKFTRLLSIFTLAIGIASVWDRKWIAESQ